MCVFYWVFLSREKRDGGGRRDRDAYLLSEVVFSVTPFL